MEDALVLARTSESVTLIHRRDSFRASKILAQRVMEHPSITVKWNTVLTEVLGKVSDAEADAHDVEDVDLLFLRFLFGCRSRCSLGCSTFALGLRLRFWFLSSSSHVT